MEGNGRWIGWTISLPCYLVKSSWQSLNASFHCLHSRTHPLDRRLRRQCVASPWFSASTTAGSAPTAQLRANNYELSCLVFTKILIPPAPFHTLIHPKGRILCCTALWMVQKPIKAQLKSQFIYHLFKPSLRPDTGLKRLPFSLIKWSKYFFCKSKSVDLNMSSEHSE